MDRCTPDNCSHYNSCEVCSLALEDQCEQNTQLRKTIGVMNDDSSPDFNNHFIANLMYSSCSKQVNRKVTTNDSNVTCPHCDSCELCSMALDDLLETNPDTYHNHGQH